MEKHKVKGPYEAVFKRLLDIIISALVIILFCWLYLILAIIVRLSEIDTADRYVCTVYT